MSNSTTLIDTIASNQSAKEVLANALFDASSPAMLWGRHASACSGLIWAYYGGWFNGAIANGTVSLTASSTNYLMADPTTGAVSVNTTGFTTGKVTLYEIVTNATTVTSYIDRRGFAPQGTAGSAVSSVNGLTGAVTLTTDQVSQGSTNKYYADSLARSAFSATGSLAYNSTTGVFSFTDAVTSVAGRTGAVTLATGDISGLGTAAALASDIDGTLAANSDTRVATQKAVKTYVSTIAGGLVTGVSSVNTKTGVVSLNSDDISQGSTNLYFANTLARAAVSASGSLSYNSATGVFSFTDAVTSVAGRTGAITLATADISGLGTVASLASDTDGTLAANSDTRVATQKAVKTYVDTTVGTKPFDVHAFYPGAPTASAKVLRIPVARSVTFSANFAGSYGKASANATGSTVFDVQKNGSSIGSITFAAGASTATFTSTGGTGQSLVAGDVLSIVAPATPDATLADPGFVLVGTR